MNKPFTLIIQETEDSIAEIINKSGLPIFCLKQIMQDLFNQLDSLDNQEIKKYNEKIKNNTNKEESDK